MERIQFNLASIEIPISETESKTVFTAMALSEEGDTPGALAVLEEIRVQVETMTLDAAARAEFVGQYASWLGVLSNPDAE